MKVTISQKNFKKALGLTDKVVAKTTMLPILSNILLKTENGRLRLSATNLEIGVSCLIGAKIDEVGEVAIPAKITSDFVSGIGDEKISLVTKNNILSVISEKYKTQIPGVVAQDFPIIPKIKTPPLCTIPGRFLREGFSSVIDSVAVSETRPELSGIFIKFTQNNITFVGTDGFRLSEKVVPVKANSDQNIILPRSTAFELLRVTNETEGEFTVLVSENQISFSTEDFELVSRLIEGNYPDYRRVIPDKTISRINVEKTELERSVKLAGLFSSNISDIKLIYSDKNLEILSKSSSKGEMQASISASNSATPFDISLNYHYLLDGLKNIETDDIVVAFTGQGSGLLLYPSGDKKDFTYLIMPLRN